MMDDKLRVTQESSDQMDLVHAFLTARYKDDEDAALYLIGGKIEDDQEHMTANPETVMNLLLGLADMCLAQMRMMAGLTGATMDEFLQTMGLVKARYMTVED